MCIKWCVLGVQIKIGILPYYCEAQSLMEETRLGDNYSSKDSRRITYIAMFCHRQHRLSWVWGSPASHSVCLPFFYSASSWLAVCQKGLYFPVVLALASERLARGSYTGRWGSGRSRVISHPLGRLVGADVSPLGKPRSSCLQLLSAKHWE